MTWRTPTHWPSRAFPAWLWLPLVPVYWLGTTLQRWYQQRTPYRAPVPVISVGNLTAGGSGKTPVVSAIAAYLSQQGYRVAIVGHGYQAAATAPTLVTAEADPRQVGDEALELAQSYCAAQVWVGGGRRACAAAATAAGAEVIILDDAFSHPYIARDLDLLVVDHHSAFGNRWLLPAGPLREGLPAQHRADAALVLGLQPGPLAALHIPQIPVRLVPSATLQGLPTKPVVAFCGLGLPDKFYRYLRAQGLSLAATHSFPDHHAYTAADGAALAQLAARHHAVLVTTPKDAVKLKRDFAGDTPLYVVRPALAAADLLPLWALVHKVLPPPVAPGIVAPATC